jgi:hypothetical protein
MPSTIFAGASQPLLFRASVMETLDQRAHNEAAEDEQRESDQVARASAALD